MSMRGRLEAYVTVPTGGWDFQVGISGIGTFGLTVSEGTYLLSTLLSTVQGLLNGASGADGVFTVSGSFGEQGTGRVTISHTVQTFSITWLDTDLRDVLGFAGNLAPVALTFTGTAHARGVWLPDCPMASRYGAADPGHTETDLSQTVSPLGDVKTLVYQSRVRLPSVRWSHVSRPRARIAGEVIVGESFEQWWRWCQGGELSYFEPGGKVLLYWDADAGTSHTYRLVGRNTTEMERAVEEWNYLYPIEITGYRVPGT